MAPIMHSLHENTPGGIGARIISTSSWSISQAYWLKGFFGDGDLPWDMVCIGAVLGIIILLIASIIEKEGISF